MKTPYYYKFIKELIGNGSSEDDNNFELFDINCDPVFVRLSTIYYSYLFY